MNKLHGGMGACSPHNGSKSRNTFLVCLFSLLLVVTFGVLSGLLFVSNNNNNIVSADSYSNPTNWESVYFTNMNNFSGRDVWTDGTNYYYDSYNSGYKHYTLDVSTLTWNNHSWTGYTGSIKGNNIFYDNGRVFFCSSTTQMIFTGTGWVNVTWSGLNDYTTTLNNANGIFKAFGYSWLRESGDYKYLDPNSYTWTVNNSYFTGLPTTLSAYNKTTFWSDGSRYFYSNGNSSQQYYYDTATSSWVVASWTISPGYSQFTASNVWTDGTNYYLWATRKLVAGTFTWSSISFTPSGVPASPVDVYDIIVTNDNTVFYCNNGTNYRLVHDVIASLDIEDPTVTQSGIMQVFDYNSNSSYLNRLGLNVYVADGTDYNNGVWNKFLSYNFSNYNYVVGSSNVTWNSNILVTSLPYAHIKYELYELNNTSNTNVSYLNMTSFDMYNTALNIVDPSSHNSYLSAYYYFANVQNSWTALNNSIILNGFCVSYFGNCSYSLYDNFNQVVSYSNSSYFSFDVNPCIVNYRFYTYDDLTSYAPRCVLYNVYYDVRLTLNNNYTFNYYTLLNSYFNSGLISSYSGLTIYDIGNTSTSVYFNDINQNTLTFYTPINIIYGNLATPLISYDSNNFTINWSKVPGADYYQIYRNNTLIVDNFIGNVYTIVDIGDYYIMAYSNLVGIGNSTSNTITVSAIPLVTPTISLNYAILSWDNISNADYYVIYAYDDINSTWSVFTTTVGTSYVLVNTDEYCVQAVSDNSLFTSSALSTDISFTGVWTPTGGGQSNTFAGLIGAVIDVPIHYVVSMFDFDMDFLGFNMLNLIMSVFTLCVLIWIIRFILGRHGDK